MATRELKLRVRVAIPSKEGLTEALIRLMGSKEAAEKAMHDEPERFGVTTRTVSDPATLKKHRRTPNEHLIIVDAIIRDSHTGKTTTALAEVEEN